jgi:hypothetical protein
MQIRALIRVSALAPLEPHHRQYLFADSKVRFLISGERLNDGFTQSRAPEMGTLFAVTTGSYQAA